MNLRKGAALVAALLSTTSLAASTSAYAYEGTYPPGYAMGNSASTEQTPRGMPTGLLKYLPPWAGAALRTVGGKLSEMPSVLDFPNVYGDGSTSSTAGFTATESAGQADYYLPPGTYLTGKNFFNGTDITHQYVGQGTLVDSAGHHHANWEIPFTHPITSRGNGADPTQWLDGDFSQNGLTIENIITSVVEQTGSLTTNAPTPAGSTFGVNNVLHFASVPSWVSVGVNVSFEALVATDATTPAALATPAPVYVQSVTATTVSLSNYVLSPGVGSGDVIKFGAGQYIQPTQNAPIDIFAYAAPGSLGGTGADAASQQAWGVNYFAQNNSGSPGALAFAAISCGTTASWPSYNIANPYLTPQCGMIGGSVYTTVDNVYLDPMEWEVVDEGKHTTANGLVIDLHRTGTALGPGQYWHGIHLNGLGATVPVDDALWVGGPYQFGLDFSMATFAPTGGNFAGPAIALAANQGIFFNTPAGTYGATGETSSAYSIYYENSTPAMHIVGGTAGDLVQMNGSAINFLVPIKQGGTAGVTCSGAPTASYATKFGIVTHC